MKIGDLVLFRSDERVPGIIVSERPANQQTKVLRIGVLWNDCSDVMWEPAESLKVISEHGEQK